MNMLASLEKRTPSKQIPNDNNQVRNNYDNIDESKNVKKFVSKKFCIEINFELRDDLIYYFDEDNTRLRLCISRSTKKNIFKTIHNNNYHFNYHRYFARICETLFISRTLNKIRIYVEHCLA